MNAKIVTLAGDDISKALIKQAEQVLTDIAVAFCHSFIFIDEKIDDASKKEYGTELTIETVDSCLHAEAVIACSRSGTGIDLLAEELDCSIRIRSFYLPESLTGLSLLRSEKPMKGFIAQTSASEADIIGKVFRLTLEIAERESAPIVFVPPTGVTRDIWLSLFKEIEHLKINTSSRIIEAADIMPIVIKNPEDFGCILCSQYPGSIFLPAITALHGIPGLLFDEFHGSGVGFFAHYVQSETIGTDDVNPLGIQRAAAAMLRDKFRLDREADCIEAAIFNVLEAGWRTGDFTISGLPRIGTIAMGKLISEQILLAGKLINR